MSAARGGGVRCRGWGGGFIMSLRLTWSPFRVIGTFIFQAIAKAKSSFRESLLYQLETQAHPHLATSCEFSYIFSLPPSDNPQAYSSNRTSSQETSSPRPSKWDS